MTDRIAITLTRDLIVPDSDTRPGWTLGVLHVDGRHFGYSCEDFDRLHAGEIKIKTRTAIPAGRYTVAMTWSPKYGRMVPEVQRVPGFQGIRIHAGNDNSDTEGCILPGLQRDVARGRVLFSADAVRWLETRIAAAVTTLEIVYQVPAGFEATQG